MKPSLKAIVFSLSILATASAHAMEDRTSWENFSEYKSDMKTKGLPRTLIIACGHQDFFYSTQLGQDHTHPNCWCVDVNEHDSGWPSGDLAQPHWKNIHANAELDITKPSSPQGYQNEFDIVVVERPGEKTIDNLWTLFNAARMVKVGGELTVDCNVYQGRNYRVADEVDFSDTHQGALYHLLSGPKERPDNLDQYQFNLFTRAERFAGLGGFAEYYYAENSSSKNKLYLEDIIRAGKHEHHYGENFNPNNICKKLELFHIQTSEKDPITFCPRSTTITMDIGNYLANWYFTDIVALGGAYQPYGKLKTGIVSATKTEDTQALMNDWLQAIRSIPVRRW